MTKRMRSAAGFTLVEALVATAIMVSVTGAVFAIMHPSSGMFQVQPEVVDIQQRLRVGVDTLSKDLMMAGAGAYHGSMAGTLMGFFAPIQPGRQGAMPAYNDPPGSFLPDAVTLFFVPTTVAQTSITQAMPNTSAELKVEDVPGCPQGEELCGFKEGMTVLIYDDTGAYDTMTITAVQNNAGHLQHNQQGDLSKAYGPGAKVAQVNQHVYFYDATEKQLMHYDGSMTAVPVAVIDKVNGVNFDYYAEPHPPQLRRPGTDQSVTYGPVPPALGVTKGNWPAGENCTIQVVGGQQVARLMTFGNPGTGLIKLTAAQMTDGPFCPDNVNTNRYDADLLRIRKIRVTLWVQAPTDALRAPLVSGQTVDPLFAARTGVGPKTVPDQIVRFDITPRNLNLTR